MAEKKYKNYDERFLKEDTSSSEPIEIEGYISTADDSRFILINQWPDGTPIETADDLESVFKARAIIFVRKESAVLKLIPDMMDRHISLGKELCLLSVGNAIDITTEQIFSNVINPPA